MCIDGSVTLTIIVKTVATDRRDTFESSVNFGQRILKKVKSEMRWRTIFDPFHLFVLRTKFGKSFQLMQNNKLGYSKLDASDE